jgi:hypothetical protein
MLRPSLRAPFELTGTNPVIGIVDRVEDGGDRRVHWGPLTPESLQDRAGNAGRKPDRLSFAEAMRLGDLTATHQALVDQRGQHIEHVELGVDQGRDGLDRLEPGGREHRERLEQTPLPSASGRERSRPSRSRELNIRSRAAASSTKKTPSG